MHQLTGEWMILFFTIDFQGWKKIFPFWKTVSSCNCLLYYFWKLVYFLHDMFFTFTPYSISTPTPIGPAYTDGKPCHMVTTATPVSSWSTNGVFSIFWVLVVPDSSICYSSTRWTGVPYILKFVILCYESKYIVTVCFQTLVLCWLRVSFVIKRGVHAIWGICLGTFMTSRST